MFRAWINENHEIDVSVDTARRWLHHLGFHQCDHQKGVCFDGHERDDVVTYRQEFLDQLASLDETTITPMHPMPVVVEGEKRYLRIAHDEFTFYSNTDQTRFWNDGQSQVLRQKLLGSNIMVSDFIVKGHGYLKDDIYMETQKRDILIMKCLLRKKSVQLRLLRNSFQVLLGYFYLIMHLATRNSQCS